MNTEQQEKIEGLLKSCKFGAISTVSTQAPESAVITIQKIDGIQIVFGSFKNSRKNLNIEKNPHVSFVVWDGETKKTIQIEGKAMPIEDIESEMNDVSFKKNPEHDYFKIVPFWVRYSDFAAVPKEVWEMEI